jgi:trans-2,3-dihydro-3-hydroxyanthranilate isomerase
MHTMRYVLCDVFTNTPLAGNALAVFTDGRGVSDVTMQALARETNLSETVFVLPSTAAGADARIRIFTPASEVPFAGHPTLGSAFVLAQSLNRDRLHLETGVGVISVELERDDARISFARMHQPIPTTTPYADDPDELLAALGVARSRLPIDVYDNGPRHVIVTVASREEVGRLRPTMSRLPALCVSVCAGEAGRWKTRMFAPALGVTEDPATGSAAGPLSIHLVRHGQIEFGSEIVIEQGTEIGRPSTLYATAHGDATGVTDVVVGGSAVTVARGEFNLPE